jgi:phosphoglycolate phosphatase
MPKYETILFDLDGTLADSKEGVTKSIQYALAKFGINIENMNSLLPLIGSVLVDEFQRRFNLKAGEARQAVGYYRDYYAKAGIQQCRIYEGIPKLLTELRELNCRITVATLKPRIYTEKILDCFKITNYFTLVECPELGEESITKPQIIERTLQRLPDCDRSKMVMIGDRGADMLAAHQHNIDCVAAMYGYGSLSELVNCNPSFYVDTVDELRQLLTITYKQV